MSAISSDAIKQIFTEARTYTSWLPKDVSDQTLHEIWDLMKWGPTSANLEPCRIVFVKSKEAKEKFLPAVAEMNRGKVKEAPATAILAMDEKFYEYTSKLYPHAPGMKDYFAGNATVANETAFRNSSLQGAYFIMAARSLGLDCGPMSGFDAAKVNTEFFPDGKWKTNFLCNLGYGDPEKLFPRNPRLGFEEACLVL